MPRWFRMRHQVVRRRARAHSHRMPNAGTTLPWPPSSGSTAPFFPGACGSQRPGINIAPAIAADGTIYTGSRAHFDAMVSYLVAVNSNLTPKWAASLQNILNDGCGVIVPIGPTTGTPNACRVGTQAVHAKQWASIRCRQLTPLHEVFCSPM